MEILKVSATSQPKSVAGAMAAVLREKGAVEVQAVGAGAVNQAVKSIAIARGYVAPNGIDMVCICTPSGLHLEPALAAITAGTLLLARRLTHGPGDPDIPFKTGEP